MLVYRENPIIGNYPCPVSSYVKLYNNVRPRLRLEDEGVYFSVTCHRGLLYRRTYPYRQYLPPLTSDCIWYYIAMFIVIPYTMVVKVRKYCHPIIIPFNGSGFPRLNPQGPLGFNYG
jgi:hypothetical protein